MDNIREFRTKTGLSQRAFADKYSLPLRSLQRWEQGQNEMPAYTLRLLQEVIRLESDSDTGARVPRWLQYAFWDTDFDKLSVLQDRSYIIARCYTKGGVKAIKWVEENYTLDDISRAARTRRDLNPIVANFLCQKCGLTRDEMKYYQGANRDWRSI